LKHNPALRVKRQKLLVALRRFESSRFFPSNPELTANGKAKLKDDPIKSSFYKLETKLSWKIPIGGWWLQRQAWLKKALARARQEWEAAQIKLSLDVRGACYEVMVQRAKANLFREMFAFFTRIHKLIEIRKQTGAANVLDLNLAYTEKLQSQASFQVAGALWVAKRRALRILMGWPQNGAKLPRIYGEVGPIVHKKLNLPSLIKRALQRHYLLGIIRKRILESKAKLAFADAKAFPDFKFGFFYTLQEDPDLQHVLGGGLTIPLPLFQRNQEKRWTQREKVLKFQLQRKALRFRIQQKVLQTYRLLRVYQKTYQLYEQRFLPTLKTQLSLNMRGLRLGRFSVLKVISAQQSQNKARMKSIETLEKAMKS
ncbi:MAG: TolC family protein, partial [Myxococcota bacterium]